MQKGLTSQGSYLEKSTCDHGLVGITMIVLPSNYCGRFQCRLIAADTENQDDIRTF